jgi:hypothetical protein
VKNSSGKEIGFWIPHGSSRNALTPACLMTVLASDGTFRDIYYVNRDRLGLKERFDNQGTTGSAGGVVFHCFWPHPIKYPEGVAQSGYTHARSMKQFTLWCEDISRWGWNYKKANAYRLVGFGEEF